jgi:hypothetical protein
LEREDGFNIKKTSQERFNHLNTFIQNFRLKNKGYSDKNLVRHLRNASGINLNHHINNEGFNGTAEMMPLTNIEILEKVNTHR